MAKGAALASLLPQEGSRKAPSLLGLLEAIALLCVERWRAASRSPALHQSWPPAGPPPPPAGATHGAASNHMCPCCFFLQSTACRAGMLLLFWHGVHALQASADALRYRLVCRCRHSNSTLHSPCSFESS